MVETIEFNNKKYPKFQAQGNASQFAIPFAKQVCNGIGFDIGCNREEWAFPGAIMIDPALNTGHAMNLPTFLVDYIFSSHCLEHIHGWVDVLDHWKTRLKPGGTLFLYLPHPDQEYWLPWNNRKHYNVLYPEMIQKYLENNGYTNIFVSGMDLNHSFMAMAEKI